MDQVSIKYSNIFHCKTLQNLPKFGFLVLKQTIWQPCVRPILQCNQCVQIRRNFAVWAKKKILNDFKLGVDFDASSSSSSMDPLPAKQGGKVRPHEVGPSPWVLS
jgi:hypothetical protein